MDAGRVVHHGTCADPGTHRTIEKVFAGRIGIHELRGQWVALPEA
jgi:iron complex transport system ATP-binding protein